MTVIGTMFSAMTVNLRLRDAADAGLPMIIPLRCQQCDDGLLAGPSVQEQPDLAPASGGVDIIFTALAWA
jgi:hypothetical protein